MRRLLGLPLIATALALPVAALAGNCGQGVGGGVGNPHCSAATHAPQTQQAGVLPPTDSTPPKQIGDVTPDLHNVVVTPIVVNGTQKTITGYGPVPPLRSEPQPSIVGYPVPPQPQPQAPLAPPQVLPTQRTPMLVIAPPVAQRTPSLAKVVTPPQVLPAQRTPMLVPPQPPAQRTPPLAQVVTPPQVLPPQSTPMLVPPQPPEQRTPLLAQAVTPTQALPPQQEPALAERSPATPVPDADHGHALIPHRSLDAPPATSGRVSEGAYSFEFIEPGLQQRKVKVYRARDAAEQVYKDTIPLDRGGFQLIVVGTRNPDYVH